jgi:hypothetical protein
MTTTAMMATVVVVTAMTEAKTSTATAQTRDIETTPS